MLATFVKSLYRTRLTHPNTPPRSHILIGQRLIFREQTCVGNDHIRRPPKRFVDLSKQIFNLRFDFQVRDDTEDLRDFIFIQLFRGLNSLIKFFLSASSYDDTSCASSDPDSCSGL
jgi:hypothetical protein